MGLEELLLDRAEKQGEVRGAEKERAKAEAKAAQEKRDIAKHLKNKGIDIKTISEATGLSVEEIEKL
ncbi:hypothetical protein [Pedobacter deserti]|uniref:hypothetical protein n=1 Tax=Pedobacter deserti TaxID=2817382 RepID=UPI00210ACB14|nr:hypothetical protein [Pedobacter sp. SYSU D00382]